MFALLRIFPEDERAAPPSNPKKNALSLERFGGAMLSILPTTTVLGRIEGGQHGLRYTTHAYRDSTHINEQHNLIRLSY